MRKACTYCTFALFDTSDSDSKTLYFTTVAHFLHLCTWRFRGPSGPSNTKTNAACGPGAVFVFQRSSGAGVVPFLKSKSNLACTRHSFYAWDIRFWPRSENLNMQNMCNCRKIQCFWTRNVGAQKHENAIRTLFLRHFRSMIQAAWTTLLGGLACRKCATVSKSVFREPRLGANNVRKHRHGAGFGAEP